MFPEDSPDNITDRDHGSEYDLSRNVKKQLGPGRDKNILQAYLKDTL